MPAIDGFKKILTFLAPRQEVRLSGGVLDAWTHNSVRESFLCSVFKTMLGHRDFMSKQPNRYAWDQVPAIYHLTKFRIDFYDE